jgi:hypothetical protein
MDPADVLEDALHTPEAATGDNRGLQGTGRLGLSSAGAGTTTGGSAPRVALIQVIPTTRARVATAALRSLFIDMLVLICVTGWYQPRATKVRATEFMQ